MNLSILRQEQTVNLSGPGGVSARFTLREMTGDEWARYAAADAKRTVLNANGVPSGVSRYDDLFALVLSHCLYGEDGALVPIATIKSWPISVQQKLAMAANKINSMNRAGAEEAKKD